MYHRHHHHQHQNHRHYYNEADQGSKTARTIAAHHWLGSEPLFIILIITITIAIARCTGCGGAHSTLLHTFMSTPAAQTAFGAEDFHPTFAKVDTQHLNIRNLQRKPYTSNTRKF